MNHPNWPSLQRYLSGVWDDPTLELVGMPRVVGGGYSRTIWLLKLRSGEWQEPRAFQVRCSDALGTGLAPEVDKLHWLVKRGYPVTPPVCLLSDASVIGRPFALLDWISGPTLAELVQEEGWRRNGAHARMSGNLLAQLHSIPSAGFPAKTTSSSRSRSLDHVSHSSGLLGAARAGVLNDLIHTYSLQPFPNVVCHLDLHPRNIVMTEDDACVIDWEKASRSHPLTDITMAQVHTEMAIALGEYPSLDDSTGFARCLLEAYLDSRSIACSDLGFFRILAACQRLGDVAGAMQRPVLLEKDRVELQAEGAVAIELIDREIGFFGGRNDLHPEVHPQPIARSGKGSL